MAVLDRLSSALSDRYRLERELGQGGMATVYLAHDLKHDRDVAIKVLHPDLGAALGGERFLTEIRTTARLQHPHILPLLDSGEADGLLYYVMPLVTGETLRARLERERQLPIADAVRIAREVASALDYAHRQNVIHRDIKPENVLLHDGSALVADFGIALAVQTAGGQRMTQTGLSLGTPQYMSPEQAMGERTIDARSDIYALGAVTYEMLVGDPPFTGSTVQAIVAKVLNERPTPPSTVRDTVPPGVERAVLTALAKLPADRPASAAVFAALLESTEAGTGAGYAPRAMAQAGPSRLSKALTAVAFMAVAALAAWGWLRPAGHAEGAFRMVPMPAGGGGSGMAISPDGSMYTESATDSTGVVWLVLRSLVGGPTRPVHAGPVAFAAFSADGRQLAYWDNSSQSLLVQDVVSGAVRTLAVGLQCRGVAWLSADAVAVSTTDGALKQYEMSGESRVLRPAGSADSLMLQWGLAPAGDGLLVARATRGGHGLLVAIGDGGRRVDSLYGPVIGLSRPTVVGDVLLFMEDGRLWGIPLAANHRRAAGGRREVLGREGTSAVGAFVAASQSGTLLVLRATGTADRQLILVGRDGRVTPAAPQHADYRRPRFAPDGKLVVSMRAAAVSGPLWITDLARGTGQWVGADSLVFAQQWTPDGRLLVAARREGKGRVTRVAADGGGSATTVLERPNSIFELELTPDGRTLVWREDAPTTGRDILMASLDRPTEAVPVRVSPWDERGIALSRDGKWLAYTSNESGGPEVYLCRLEANGPRWAVTQGGGAEPRWGAGGELFYRKQDSVFVLRVTGAGAPVIGKPAFVAQVPAVTAIYEPLWDVRRDGQQFVMVRQVGAERREQFLVLDWERRWREAGK